MTISSVDFLFERIAATRDELAIAMPGRTASYGDLLGRIETWSDRLATLAPGTIASIEGDYGVEAIAAFLAAIRAGAIVVPMSPDSSTSREIALETAAVEARIDASGSASAGVTLTGRTADHPLYAQLRAEGHPGLVLFSSGSTGRPKAAVHDLSKLLAKYAVPRRRYRTLVFLLLDHIGGVNTLFYTLSNGGAVVVTEGRSPAAVCDAIERHRVELLPTSPTFLNLLLLSGEPWRRDLSSLQLITYGTEPMPKSTLDRACEAFPNVRFLQTYGLTELGILRSQSRDSNSLWVRVGGEGFESKVVDGRLWIRAASAILGYLNAPSPFDADGFFDTGDLVEVDGEWIRFLGRSSEVINVGGLKIHPAAVESVLLQMSNVADVVVRGEPHSLTGQIVTAHVRLAQPEPFVDFKVRMRQFCRDRLAPHEIPVKVHIADGPIHSARFKRVRHGDTAALSAQP